MIKVFELTRTAFLILSSTDESREIRAPNLQILHVNAVLTCVITAQPHLIVKGISTAKPWSSPKTQWNEHYCREGPGVAERVAGTPHSSCWLERSIHICACLGFPLRISGLCSRAYLQLYCFAVTLAVKSFVTQGGWAKILEDLRGGIVWTWAAVPFRPVRGQCSSMKQPACHQWRKKDWFLWFPSLIRFHAVPELLAASIR